MVSSLKTAKFGKFQKISICLLYFILTLHGVHNGLLAFSSCDFFQKNRS